MVLRGDIRSTNLLQQADSAQIKELEHCDFRPMYEYFEIQKDKKKSLTAAEKKMSVMTAARTRNNSYAYISPQNQGGTGRDGKALSSCDDRWQKGEDWQLSC